MNRQTSPLYLRVSIGLGLATAAITSAVHADPGLLARLLDGAASQSAAATPASRSPQDPWTSFELARTGRPTAVAGGSVDSGPATTAGSTAAFLGSSSSNDSLTSDALSSDPPSSATVPGQNGGHPLTQAPTSSTRSPQAQSSSITLPPVPAAPDDTITPLAPATNSPEDTPIYAATAALLATPAVPVAPLSPAQPTPSTQPATSTATPSDSAPLAAAQPAPPVAAPSAPAAPSSTSPSSSTTPSSTLSSSNTSSSNTSSGTTSSGTTSPSTTSPSTTASGTTSHAPTSLSGTLPSGTASSLIHVTASQPATAGHPSGPYQHPDDRVRQPKHTRRAAAHLDGWRLAGHGSHLAGPDPIRPPRHRQG